MRSSILLTSAFYLLTSAFLNAAEPRPADDLWEPIRPFTKPPAEFAGKTGEYRSPLLFNDGTAAKTPADWKRRRAEIAAKWHERLGERPAYRKNVMVSFAMEEPGE